MGNATIVSREQPKRRHWFRAFLWLAVAVIVLVIVAYFVVTSPAFIKGVVLPRVGDSLNASVSAGDVSFHPFRQIELRDLKVQPNGQTPVLVIPEANLRYHLWDILGGNIRVDEITFDSPTVELVENPDGSKNIDPMLKALEKKPAQSQAPAPSRKSSKAPQIDLGKLTLRNAKVLEIKNFGDGQSNVMELTNLDFSLSNLKNGQSATAELSAALWVNDNSPNGTNGFLAATLNGKFTVALTADMKPATASGNAQFNVSAAHGLFNDFSSLTARLDCDATSTEIRQLDFHFQRGDTPLGELSASGPLDLATMEGSVQVALRGIDKRLLNLAGAGQGIDFGSTTISSTNEIQLSNAGKSIAVTGRFAADKFQLTRADQTTPMLDFTADYAVEVDSSAQRALLQKLTVSGSQQGRPLLDARLSEPMTLAWGTSTNAVGNSKLDLTVTNLNLADWRPFVGNSVSSGDVNLQLRLSSEQGGNQLSFDLNSQINNLAARFGSNQTFQATVDLSAQGQAADFKQFNLNAYRLQILRQSQPLLTASGSGTFNSADASADMQLALEASLPGLNEAFPQPDTKLSSGTLKLNGRVTQKGNSQTVTGRLALADLTGQIGNNSFQNYGSSMDMGVTRSPDTIQIQKLDGELTQNGSSRGNVSLSGAVDSATKKVDLNAKLSNFNQDGLRPFLQPLLGGKQLVSIAVNGNAAVQYAPNTSSTIKADLQVTNLVVHDPAGQIPATPLEVQLQMDTSVKNQIADIHQFQLGLTATARARNQIQLQGHVDFSKTNAVQGGLNLTSDGLDLTRYYDLFVSKTSRSSGKAAAIATPEQTSQPAPPKNLPFQNFIVAANIRQLYLEEVVVTNLQTTVKLDGGHVLVNPLELALNGAPVNGSLDLDMTVPGYKYSVAADADGVPLAPLVNTFMPDRRGELAGTFTAHTQLANPGTMQNLTGQFEVNATNLNLALVNVHSQILKTVINVVATIPQLISNPETAALSLLTRVTGLSNSGLMNQLQKSPIQTITAKGTAGSGVITLESAMVQSTAFEADASGTIKLAPELTNSVINIPITISLSRSIAGQLNLSAANAAADAYVPLPPFLTLTRTLGDPKPDISRTALVGITVRSLGNSLLKPSNGNQSPVGNLLNQLLRK